MKTSFYFVLWIGLYLLIGLFGGQWMQQNSFFVALVAVWAVSGLVNKLTEPQRAYMAQRQALEMFELAYCNDFKRYLGFFRRRMWFDLATLVYFVITVIFLLMVHENWIIIAIFAFFGYGCFKTFNSSYDMYTSVRKTGRIELGEESMAMYAPYKEARDSGIKVDQMYPAATWKDKLLRGCNMGFSILSILIGITYIGLYIPGLLAQGVTLMGSAMLVAYGGLAFIYGIYDLITSIYGYNTN